MSTILTSLHGREIGLDKDRYLTTPVGIKVPALYLGTDGSETLTDISDITTVTAASTGTTIPNRGLALINSTAAAKTYTLADPTASGLFKDLFYNVGTSTLLAKVITAAALITSTDGSTQNTLSFNANGQSYRLRSLTTALWAVMGRSTTVLATT